MNRKKEHKEPENGFEKPLMIRRIEDRIEELWADERDLVTKKELAVMAGVSTATVSYYFKDSTAMPVSFLFWLAIRLGVTADYLLGLSDAK